MSVTISKENVDFAKGFLVQYLKDAGYEGSLEDGTAVYDVLIKPFALLYTMFSQDRKKAEAYLSLQKAQEYKNELGVDYEDAVDSILSNFFINRHDGQVTTGTISLSFIKPLNFLQLKQDEVICSIEGEDFLPQQEYVFTTSDFTAYFNTTTNTNEYRVNVDVESENNAELNITTETQVKGNLNNIYYLSAKPVYSFTPGSYKEPADQFIHRSKKSLTTRELISDRAINTVLLDKYADLRSVYIAGYGSPEQIRDIVTWQYVTVHVGNKADIYLKAPIVEQEKQVTSDGSVVIEDHNAMVLDVQNTSGVSFSFTVDADETLLGTAKYYPTISTSSGEVTVFYLTCPLVKQISDFMLSIDNRVTCYDPLIKSSFPVVLDFSISVILKPTLRTESEIINDLKEVAVKYINHIEQGDKYFSSILIQKIHSEVAEIKKVATPLECTATVFDPKTNNYQSIDVGDELGSPSTSIQSNQFSLNTLQFFTGNNHINVTTFTD